TMCDYSLMAIPNRLAEEGEELVTHRFWTGSLGFASPLDMCKAALPLGRRLVFWPMPHENMYFKLREANTRAICIPPGTRLILQDIPQSLQCDLKIGPTEEVTLPSSPPQQIPFATLSASETVARSCSRNFA